jgi:hypothetical protein
MTAEISSGNQLPEEAYAAKSGSNDRPSDNDGPSAMAVIGIILAVIALIVFIGWLGDGCSGCRSEPSTGSDPAPGDPTPVRALKDLPSFTMSGRTTSATEVRVLIIRQNIENGTVTSAQRLENKFLNYRLRDEVQAALSR